MIITVRGTSGSGKSTVVKKLIELYQQPGTPGYIDSRRKPHHVDYQHPQGGRPLRVMGHYECATGGGDTLTTFGLDYIFKYVEWASEHDEVDVLIEGLVVSSDTVRTFGIHKRGNTPIHVIHLIEPMEKCVESVGERRRAGGNMQPLNPDATEVKWRFIKKSVTRFDAAGVPNYVLNREETYDKLRELLNV